MANLAQLNAIPIKDLLKNNTEADFKKFLSIAIACNASIALWIVSEIEDPTKAIIQWLNHRTEWKTRFLIAKIEGYKIGDSLPVIHLSKI